MARAMTICLVSQEYPPETGGGGIGTQTWLRATGLARRGHRMHVVSVSPDGRERVYDDGGATIHRIAPPRIVGPAYEQSTYWLAYSQAVAAKLAELEKEVAFDVIQFPEYGGEGFVFQTDTWAYRKAKYVVQMHGPLAMFAEYWGWPERESTLMRVGGFMEKTVLQYADLLLASTRHTAAYCGRAYGVETSGSGVVYSGVDVGRFSPRKQEADGRSPRVLFVGALSEGKGFMDLLRVVGRLKGRFPRIVLRAIGKADAGQRAGMEKVVEEQGLAGHFELAGFVPYEKLPEHYAWCDFFAAPSVYEGGPGNVYLEAMACGRGVVACRTGGVPEVVVEGETGLLVGPHDLDGLEGAVARLAEDADLRERFGRAGRRRVEERFSVEKYLDACEGHYRALCAGGGA
jgi:glycosyltransferase involved in cell wall biosynthesis